jgi:hypothetical protein
MAVGADGHRRVSPRAFHFDEATYRTFRRAQRYMQERIHGPALQWSSVNIRVHT